MAAYGGINHVKFFPSGEISVQPMIMPHDRLELFNAHLMLFYTGIKRTASDVASTYVEDIESRRRQLRVMSGSGERRPGDAFGIGRHHGVRRIASRGVAIQARPQFGGVKQVG